MRETQSLCCRIAERISLELASYLALHVHCFIQVDGGVCHASPVLSYYSPCGTDGLGFSASSGPLITLVDHSLDSGSFRSIRQLTRGCAAVSLTVSLRPPFRLSRLISGLYLVAVAFSYSHSVTVVSVASRSIRIFVFTLAASSCCGLPCPVCDE